jgi:hypothetical protein
MIGKKYGNWTVIEEPKLKHKNGRNRTVVLVECVCNTRREVLLSRLNRGGSCGCGCTNKPPVNETHGLSHTRIYKIFYKMKTRCYNPSDKNYNHYGGRGISICDAWLNEFSVFYEWAKSNGYKANLSIDRIDVNGNYEPGNCRWVTQDIQLRNTRRSRFLTINGETKNLIDWSIKSGVYASTIRHRISQGSSPKEAISMEPFKSSMAPVKSLTTGQQWDSCKACGKGTRSTPPRKR